MTVTQRTRRVATAAAAAAVIGGGGVAIGTVTAGSGGTAAPAAVTGAAAPSSYASVVRQVLPSVVLIRTADGLGSGVVLDRSGDIVTNAHVAGDSTSFQVQAPADPAPRAAHLVGSYAPDDLAVIRVDDSSGLQPARFGNSDQAQAGDVVWPSATR